MHSDTHSLRVPAGDFAPPVHGGIPVCRRMILDTLRRDTRPHHDRAEQALAILDPGLTRAHYAALLAAMHAFYVPLEARLARVPGLPLDLAPRLKAPLLARDLAALGVPAIPAAPAEALPALPDAHAALGCLYVLEGATLGGQVIGRHLARALDVHPANGGAFFASYGAEVGPMWKAFRAALAGFVERDGEMVRAAGDARVVAAAMATFDALTAWLERAGVTGARRAA